MFELVGEIEPLLARSGAQVAERADGLLARPVGGLHRLDEDIIGIGLAFVAAHRAADIHVSLRTTKTSAGSREIFNILVTISHYYRQQGISGRGLRNEFNGLPKYRSARLT